MMNLRQKRRYLIIAAAVTTCVAVCVLGLGLGLPLASDSMSGGEGEAPLHPLIEAASVGEDSSEGDGSERLLRLQEAAKINLRKPLFETPPTVTSGDIGKLPPALAQRIAATKTTGIKLIGTVVENDPERSAAILQLQDGSIRVAMCGGTFEGQAGDVTVKSVERDRASIDAAGKTQLLMLPTMESGVSQ